MNMQDNDAHVATERQLGLSIVEIDVSVESDKSFTDAFTQTDPVLLP